MKDIIIHCVLYLLPVKYMYNIIVRAIEESDIANAKQLCLQARLDTFTRINPGTYNLPDFDIDTEGKYILAAIDKGALAGFISVWLADNFIHHLYVDKNHQEKRTGSALLQAATNKTGLPVRLKCLQRNTKAEQFYRKKGFVITDKNNGEEGAYVVMEFIKTNW